MDDCKFCHQTPTFSESLIDSWFDKYESQIELASGGWTVMYIGVNEGGDVVMRACGDDYTDDYFPKYCPECGRMLRSREMET